MEQEVSAADFWKNQNENNVKGANRMTMIKLNGAR